MACLKAAIAAGADAIYLGGQRFSARAFAGNFSDEELPAAIRLAHFFGKKIYLTVNTLMKDAELEGLEAWLRPFYEAGLDGVIFQDLGVLERCRRSFPGLALHASTQLTVTESGAAGFLKRLGVSRIVPARELSLEEIRRLKEESGMEIETFIHGALCYCYSGQCLFSSLLGGRSGNRGRCAQPCRLPYEIRRTGRRDEGNVGNGGRKGMERYPLSLKDLCALPLLPLLIGAGIDSFKIEGRMKGPEYVAGVTAVYRKYMDRCYASPERYGILPQKGRAAGAGGAGAAHACLEGWRIEQEDLDLLSGLYVRSETGTGYYERYNGREMVTLQAPGYSGCEPALLEGIREKWLKDGLTKPVNLKAALTPGMPARLEAECDGIRTETEGAQVMEARNRPMTEQEVVRQLSRTGGSCFAVRQVSAELNGSCFLPLSALNSLRREALDALFETMTERYARGRGNARLLQAEPVPVPEAAGRSETGTASPPLHVSVLFIPQGLAAIEEPEVKRICLSSDAVLDASAGPFWEAVRRRKAKEGDFSLFLALPAILRARSAGYQERLERWLRSPEGALTDGFLAAGLSGLCLAQRLGKPVSLSHGLYVFNEETWRFFMRHFPVDTYTAPLELNRHELRRLPVRNQERMVYGRIPMMISANCVRRTSGDCAACGQGGSPAGATLRREFSCSLIDRYQTAFPVYINCIHCMNTIYNSVPLSLHRYREDIAAEGVRALRLEFTDEAPETVRQVIRCFAGDGALPVSEYTTGHYKKGVQ